MCCLAVGSTERIGPLIEFDKQTLHQYVCSVARTVNTPGGRFVLFSDGGSLSVGLRLCARFAYDRFAYDCFAYE
jgi:hypothetical protein